MLVLGVETLGRAAKMSAGNGCKCEDEMELRRGPWTLEEDTLLIHYIACHGEGRWNLLARCSGLKRTGKSCRLRWLNYLKPDVKRGNLTPEEQILILELHSKWGNRWSRIAQHLPGRTDNEIKNYWRTRVQKQARQLKIDANSTMFTDAVRCLWMPRLMEKMSSSLPSAEFNLNPNICLLGHALQEPPLPPPPPPPPSAGLLSPDLVQLAAFDSSCSGYNELLAGSENCSPCISSDSMAVAQLPAMPEFSPSPPDAVGNYLLPQHYNLLLPGGHHINDAYGLGPAAPMSASGGSSVGSPAADYSMVANSLADNVADSLWSMDELWQVRELHEWEN